jgi:hypothetical protein
MVEAELGGWLPVAGVRLSHEQRSRVFEQAETALGAYQASEGTVQFDSPAHIVTASKAQAQYHEDVRFPSGVKNVLTRERRWE